MNVEFVFTLADLGKIVLWAALITVLIYIILILQKAYASIKDIRAIVKDNRENIDAVLDSAPGITQHIEEITGFASNGLDSAKTGISKFMENRAKKKENK